MARIAIGTSAALLMVGAAAYAAVGGESEGGGERREPAATAISPASPMITEGSGALRIAGHPPALSTESTARFRVEASGEPALRCRLDRRPAQECHERAVQYRGLDSGPHVFYVQALRRGRIAARADFGWTVLEPKPFTVSPEPETVGPLYPGAAPSPIPVTISNPNPVPIAVTSLRVTASGGPPDCAPADNVALTAPALAGGRLRIAAHGSVALPSATVAAPTIALRELPVDQDACQNAAFDLAFSGSAGG